MNEVMDTLTAAFKELRSDRSGREHYICTEECLEAEKDMAEKEKAFEVCQEQFSEEQRQCLTSYLDSMARYHFEEEQRAYMQGMVDAVLLLGGSGLLKHDSNVEEIIDRIRH